MNPFLKQALDLADKRRGYTFPNPAVGAVVVLDDQVIGQGVHWAAGYPHAEVEALKDLPDQAGMTLVVTLEPCCHYGRTPPCTELILSKKISKVIYGHPDPDPRVRGKGAQDLKNAGIEVVHLEEPAVEEFYKTYDYWVNHGKTWLTGKIALTQEGGTASGTSERLVISGKEANRYTQWRRSRADILLTSESTVRKDNPRMTARLPDQEIKKPIGVLDRDFAFSLNSQLLASASGVELLGDRNRLAARQRQFEESGIRLLGVECKENKLVLQEVPGVLAERGYHEAWVECGAQLFSSFVRQGLFQEIVLYFSNRASGKEGKLTLDATEWEQQYQLLEKKVTEDDRIEIWRNKNL